MTTLPLGPLMRPSLISLVLDVWDRLEWRHHGTGMLQAYLPDSSGRPRDDARVHVWHPSLLLPGMTTSGAMHNHRFAFRSSVLVGAILHTHLEIERDKFGPHQLWRCPLAGAAGTGCPLEPDDRVRMRMSEDRFFVRGHSYTVLKGAYHWARPASHLGVTLVDMREKDRNLQSMLVAPYGTTPVHAFAHVPTDGLKWAIARMPLVARELLEREVAA